MADIGWRRRRGSSPAAPTGARQRAGLTPLPPPTHFHASGRRFTHNSSGQSKNPLTAITVSTAERTLHPARVLKESLTPQPELENSQDPFRTSVLPLGTIFPGLR